MALQKSITTPSGAAATYWKAAVIELDHYRNEAHVLLLGFIDQQARDAGLRPLDSRSFFFEHDGFTGFGHEVNNTQVAYAKIKTSPEFADAIDVLE